MMIAKHNTAAASASDRTVATLNCEEVLYIALTIAPYPPYTTARYGRFVSSLLFFRARVKMATVRKD